MAGIGFGPLASPPGIDDPGRLLEPPAPSARWLAAARLPRSGCPSSGSRPASSSLPLVVYIISYIPWAMVESHQIFAGLAARPHRPDAPRPDPARCTRYHNGLTAAHPGVLALVGVADEPQARLVLPGVARAGTSAALYDAGSLVIWWIGIPAIAFVSWMAYRRRSLALALIAVGFAAQWIPWARIDRAAFQYHYYTALPFVVMALAYFVAELWHGASRHTWALARVAAGSRSSARRCMWILARPLCAFVDVLSVNPGRRPARRVIPERVVTARTAALARRRRGRDPGPAVAVPGIRPAVASAGPRARAAGSRSMALAADRPSSCGACSRPRSLPDDADPRP